MEIWGLEHCLTNCGLKNNNYWTKFADLGSWYHFSHQKLSHTLMPVIAWKVCCSFFFLGQEIGDYDLEIHMHVTEDIHSAITKSTTKMAKLNQTVNQWGDVPNCLSKKNIIVVSLSVTSQQSSEISEFIESENNYESIKVLKLQSQELLHVCRGNERIWGYSWAWSSK